jgi:alanine racemase
MSHLARAEDPDHPVNARQRRLFEKARAQLPPWRCSLANSSGTFLGPDFRYDLVRCGAALYGINPQPAGPNPMDQVVRLQARILQIREIDAIRTVGYGADRRVPRGSRLATVAVGYGDGYPRAAFKSAKARIRGREVPVVGRVSMDLITLDVSSLPPSELRLGDHAEMIGPHFTVDDLGRAAGTIGYEILTGLGERYTRSYSGA